MKRNYVTPIIAVEYYNLTQSIAACATKIGFMNSECVIDDPDATNDMKDLAFDGWFAAGACIDGEMPEGVEFEDGICYHTNAQAAFNS